LIKKYQKSLFLVVITGKIDIKEIGEEYNFIPLFKHW